MAERCGVSVAQLCVKYALQHGRAPLVKSVTRERIEDNLKLDFTISSEDMEIMDEVSTCEGYRDITLTFRKNTCFEQGDN